MKVAALLLALHAAYSAAEDKRAAPQLLLIKTHAPTYAMRTRWCQMISDAARLQRDWTVRILYTGDPHNATRALPPSWCSHAEDFSREMEWSKLEAAWGEPAVSVVRSRPWELSGVLEVAYYCQNMEEVMRHSSVWALEQDVAWTGNLLNALALAGNMDGADMQCLRPNTITITQRAHQWLPRWAGLRDTWPHSRTHSGWADDASNATRVRCVVFVTRFVPGLLKTLNDDYLAHGMWAHAEWFAPTVCARTSGCVVADLPAALPRGEPFSWSVYDAVTSEANWLSKAQGNRAPALFHPVKV